MPSENLVATPQSPAIALREPEPRDGARMHQFVQEHGGLELNSAYAYLLLCERFRSSCVLAEADGILAGFVLGITSAARADTLFVWQIGVHARFRKQGLAERMLDTILRRATPRFLEAHVASGNAPSEALFRATARDHGAPLAVSAGFPSDWFPTPHAQERLFCIGPFAW